jgi:thioredoxin-related protein
MHKWIRTVGLAIFLLLISDAAPAGKKPEGLIRWRSFDAAQQQENAEKRKFMVFFHADWCSYCLKLEKNAFSSPEIADYINANFVPVKVDTMKEGQTAARFGVRGLPDIRFLTPEGDGIAKIPGYVENKQLLTLLKFISTDSYKTMSIKEFASRQGNK